MGKKSRRRGGNAPTKGPKKKGGSPPPPARAATSVASGTSGGGYSMLELLSQSALLDGIVDGYRGGKDERWAQWDDGLRGFQGAPYDEECKDEGELTGKIDKMNISAGDDGTKTHPEGSMEALKAGLEGVWADQTLSNPGGAGLAMGPKGDWMYWATELAQDPERVGLFKDEYDKDLDMHRTELQKLSSKKESHFPHGGLDHVLALHCILMDTLDRLGLDPPPEFNLYQALMLRMKDGDSLFNTRLQAWRGYERLVFQILDTVKDRPLIPKPGLSDYARENPVRRVENRGEFPRATKRYEKIEERLERDMEWGMGARPWDDDAHEVMAALDGYYD